MVECRIGVRSGYYRADEYEMPKRGLCKSRIIVLSSLYGMSVNVHLSDAETGLSRQRGIRHQKRVNAAVTVKPDEVQVQLPGRHNHQDRLVPIPLRSCLPSPAHDISSVFRQAASPPGASSYWFVTSKKAPGNPKSQPWSAPGLQEDRYGVQVRRARTKCGWTR